MVRSMVLVLTLSPQAKSGKETSRTIYSRVMDMLFIKARELRLSSKITKLTEKLVKKHPT